MKILGSVFTSDVSSSLIVSKDNVLNDNDRSIELNKDGKGDYTATLDFKEDDFFTFA